MVMESDRAGAIVTCPNCKRALRVPSGKDRGLELAQVPAAAKTRTSRQCPRCDKDIPIDTQICPHCKQILLDDGGQPAEGAQAPAAAPARPAMSRMAAIKGTAAQGARGGARPGQAQQKPGFQIKYGGARTGAFGQMPSGQRNAFLIGGGLALVVLVVAVVALGLWGASNSLEGARKMGNDALAEGPKLENAAKFTEAYEGYQLALSLGREKALLGSKDPNDQNIAKELRARIVVLQNLVPEARTRENVQWRPEDQKELDAATAHCRETWPQWRNWCLTVDAAGQEAVRVGKTTTDQKAFEAEVGKTMKTLSDLVHNSDEKQRAQNSYQQLLAGLIELGQANKHWDDVPQRKQCLMNAGEYFSASKDFVSTDSYPDAIRNVRGS
jgi:hypothetical protein